MICNLVIPTAVCWIHLFCIHSHQYLCYSVHLQVSKVEEYWSWLEDKFIPYLYPGQWYNGNPNYTLGMVADSEPSKIISMARLRLLRIKKGQLNFFLCCKSVVNLTTRANGELYRTSPVVTRLPSITHVGQYECLGINQQSETILFYSNTGDDSPLLIWLRFSEPFVHRLIGKYTYFGLCGKHTE